MILCFRLSSILLDGVMSKATGEFCCLRSSNWTAGLQRSAVARSEPQTSLVCSTAWTGVASGAPWCPLRWVWLRLAELQAGGSCLKKLGVLEEIIVGWFGDAWKTGCFWGRVGILKVFVNKAKFYR